MIQVNKWIKLVLTYGHISIHIFLHNVLVAVFFFTVDEIESKYIRIYDVFMSSVLIHFPFDKLSVTSSFSIGIVCEASGIFHLFMLCVCVFGHHFQVELLKRSFNLTQSDS